MTPNEFSDLTGLDMKADNFMDEYTMANAAYMAAGDLDKQIFCDNYKKHGITSTVRALTDQVDKLKAAYRERDDTCAEIGDEYEKLSNAYSELEQENASLRAEVASLKKKYQLYDYYQKQCSLYEQQIEALRKAISGLTSFIEAKA